MKVLIKWSKTMQTRDAVQVISLPRVTNRAICPYKALKTLKKLYPMTEMHAVCQVRKPSGWQPLTDTRVRKALNSINITLGLDPHFFTYHSGMGQYLHTTPMSPYSRSKRHGMWSSECVWRYIQSDYVSGEALAISLAAVINA